MAQKSYKQWAAIATLTIYLQHSIEQLAMMAIVIPDITAKSEEVSTDATTTQLTGSSFQLN
ncbi:hypothetical protein BG74_04610 [Sodalis-like endosymbiont of Proechinophthirus fluctus]|uniref:hypothetical protein n=1 Tax=Sodalis-like endosymbiont of Proechinophthirus fluctus TaxID=1462730 RepID=UPI0007A917BB|nr:hypothetical protein [Sodalis-like endosymbiont of Proechinophthirus fluctus]KYP97247.1 hypothetical protein BG74_04610 [Sodalis-like endosymbiont of Proechinophthirus fluctus]